MRRKTSLNGWWNFRTPGGQIDKKVVPSSYLCLGEAVFERTAEISAVSDERVFLHFEGIAYEGVLWVNDTEMGKMLPYVPYKFDITGAVRNGANAIRVNLKDIRAGYGPTEGWESYGGIIRDVYLENVSSVHIEDYQWKAGFSDDYQAADCTLDIYIKNSTAFDIRKDVKLRLSYKDGVVYSESKAVILKPGLNHVQFHFDVQMPRLWSPEFPHLYDLEMEISDDEATGDRLKETVGFKSLYIEGTKFFLNGEEIILKGVCRHDMWGDDQGFTLTEEQMEQDMRMIKEMGANFVRLVHYPHHKTIIEIADRIGLMVSEEPGLWFSDLEDDYTVDSAAEVMRRTILRDRNNVSVAFWLAFNECIFTDKYLSKITQLCKETDPTRMISGANFMNPQRTKEMFDKYNVDFYTYHPYGHYPDQVQGGVGSRGPTSIAEVLKVFNGKPVIFTEWGGWDIRDNPGLMKNFGLCMVDFVQKSYPEPSLAGFVFWEWADMIQTHRGYPGCEEGILTEGLVDIYRNKKAIYYTMSEIFSWAAHGLPRKTHAKTAVEGITIEHSAECVPISLSSLIQSERQKRVWEEAKAKGAARDQRKRRRSHITGPVIPEDVVRIGEVPVEINTGAPLILTESNQREEIEIGVKASRIYFFGHVTYPYGYPVFGDLGHAVAAYTLIYEEGTQERIILKNGVDLTSSSIIWGPSRVNPMASKVRRALKLTLDMDWEMYQVNYSTIEVKAEKKLDKIVFELIDPDYMPLLYGITVVRG